MLEHRGVFYAARMLSSQLEQEFVIPNYDDIKKVYSIWICMEPSKKLANTIVEYHMTEHEIFGSVNRGDICDLLSVVMIRLNTDSTEEAQTHSLIGMLDLLFSQKLSVAERKNKLSQTYGLTMTEKIEGGMFEMCNLSDLIVERGLAECIEKGIEKGIERGMEVKAIEIALSMLQAGEPEEKIMLYTGLSLEEIADIKPKKL